VKQAGALALVICNGDELTILRRLRIEEGEAFSKLNYPTAPTIPRNAPMRLAVQDIWKKAPCISEKPRYMAESAKNLFYQLARRNASADCLNHFCSFGRRCGQPAQQHGRRLPAANSVCARSIRRARV